jgi:hypothetical protein
MPILYVIAGNQINYSCLTTQQQCNYLLILDKVKILPHSKIADWVINYLGQHFQQKPKQEITIKDMKNVDEVKKAYKKLRHKP